MTSRWLPVCLLLVGCSSPGRAAEVPTHDSVIAQMRRVADWQLRRVPGTQPASPVRGGTPNTDWTRGALFTGIMATWQTTQDARYFDAMLNMGDNQQWRLGPRPRHADDHCVGQTFVEIYLERKDPRMIAHTRQTFDAMIADPKPGRVDWWWCDALFMAPPVLARLTTATGDRKYLDFMNKMWWDTTDFLYDPQEHLYFRDDKYLIKPDGTGRREKNGQKVFWSRGNGWVIAGTARVLQHMPEDYPDRPKYIKLLREMAEKLAAIQQPDGLWRASLLDPDSYPGGETSGSGFHTFGIAWGINQGLLDRDRYLPVVLRSWAALTACVNEAGRLGYVQPIGEAPVTGVAADSNTDFGAGAFLLAASEIARLKP